MKTTIAIVTAALFAGAAVSPAYAEMLTFTADLSGGNEVPANDSAAEGAAEVTLDTETNALTWTVTYSGLSGPLIGSHIHGPAGTGANAGVLVPLKHGDSPMEGTAEMTDEQVEFLRAGQTYVNLHTENFPGGEIRGNLTQAE